MSVNNKSGIVIAPDGFTGTIAASYDATAWATAESNGFVFLPNTGFRNNSTDIVRLINLIFTGRVPHLGIPDMKTNLLHTVCFSNGIMAR